MNAMDRHNLDIPVYTPSDFKKLPTMLTFFQSFLCAPKFW